MPLSCRSVQAHELTHEAPAVNGQKTPMSGIAYRVVWPGRGPPLQEGQRVGLRWNIAKSFLALACLDPDGPPGLVYLERIIPLSAKLCDV